MAAKASLNVVRSWRRDRGMLWLSVSVLLAATTAIALLVVPLGMSMSAEENSMSVPGGTPETGTSIDGPVTEERWSLLDVEGWGVAGFLAIPVALCVAPALTPSRIRGRVAIGSTLLLGVAVVISSASVGWFFLPTVLTMAIATSQLCRRFT